MRYQQIFEGILGRISLLAQPGALKQEEEACLINNNNNNNNDNNNYSRAPDTDTGCRASTGE